MSAKIFRRRLSDGSSIIMRAQTTPSIDAKVETLTAPDPMPPKIAEEVIDLQRDVLQWLSDELRVPITCRFLPESHPHSRLLSVAPRSPLEKILPAFRLTP